MQIAKESFEERSLKLVVMDVDPLQRSPFVRHTGPPTPTIDCCRHIPIGSITYALHEYARIKQQRVLTWQDLSRFTNAPLGASEGRGGEGRRGAVLEG